MKYDNTMIENRIKQVYGERSIIASGIIKELRKRSNSRGA